MSDGSPLISAEHISANNDNNRLEAFVISVQLIVSHVLWVRLNLKIWKDLHICVSFKVMDTQGVSASQLPNHAFVVQTIRFKFKELIIYEFNCH